MEKQKAEANSTQQNKKTGFRFKPQEEQRGVSLLLTSKLMHWRLIPTYYSDALIFGDLNA